MRPSDLARFAGFVAASGGGGGGAGGGGGGGGGGSAVVAITNQSVSKNSIHSVTVTATYSVGSDGGIYNQAGALLETWLTGGVSSGFQVQATKTSGDTPTGSALGSWLAASTTRGWSLTAADGESKACTLSVSIRDSASPNTVRDTATITISASSSTVDIGG